MRYSDRCPLTERPLPPFSKTHQKKEAVVRQRSFYPTGGRSGRFPGKRKPCQSSTNSGPGKTRDWLSSVPQDRSSGLSTSLRDDFLYHLPAHVGQAEVAAEVAVGQPLVVQSHQVQDGRVKVGGLGFCPRVRGAHLDPGFQIRHLSGREPGLGRHLQFLVRVANGLNEQALVRIPSYHGVTGIAAAPHAVAGVQKQSPLGFFRFGAVALVAVLTKMGRTFFSKNSTWSAGGGGAPGRSESPGEAAPKARSTRTLEAGRHRFVIIVQVIVEFVAARIHRRAKRADQAISDLSTNASGQEENVMRRLSDERKRDPADGVSAGSNGC